MTQKENLKGRQFDRLEVIEEMAGQTRVTWLCLCKCGNYTKVMAGKLKSGHTTSCGCKKREGNHTTHGLSKTRAFKTWRQIKQRCYNTNNPDYEDYGGRGIAMCDRWLESFANFFADMGETPTGMSIDRIDNEKGYSPDNCRWADDFQQAFNRRSTRLVTYNGETHLLSEWPAIIGKPKHLLFDRIYKRGMTPEEALHALSA